MNPLEKFSSFHTFFFTLFYFIHSDLINFLDRERGENKNETKKKKKNNFFSYLYIKEMMMMMRRMDWKARK